MKLNLSGTCFCINCLGCITVYELLKILSYR